VPPSVPPDDEPPVPDDELATTADEDEDDDDEGEPPCPKPPAPPTLDDDDAKLPPKPDVVEVADTVEPIPDDEDDDPWTPPVPEVVDEEDEDDDVLPRHWQAPKLAPSAAQDWAPCAPPGHAQATCCPGTHAFELEPHEPATTATQRSVRKRSIGARMSRN
jgi:hypothetical protein